MLKTVVPLLAVSVASVFGLQEYLKYREETKPQQTAEVAATQVPKPASINQQATRVQPDQPLYGRKARLKMDSRGHFIATSKMNGRNVEVLIDTGATSVAINKKTARRLGIHLKASDFKHTVNTANGSTKAATAIIKKVQIGKVTVKNVQAVVLDDRALSSTLLGMSFLRELKSFEVKDQQLLLVQ